MVHFVHRGRCGNHLHGANHETERGNGASGGGGALSVIGSLRRLSGSYQPHHQHGQCRSWTEHDRHDDEKDQQFKEADRWCHTAPFDFFTGSARFFVAGFVTVDAASKTSRAQVLADFPAALAAVSNCALSSGDTRSAKMVSFATPEIDGRPFGIASSQI